MISDLKKRILQNGKYESAASTKQGFLYCGLSQFFFFFFFLFPFIEIFVKTSLSYHLSNKCLVAKISIQCKQICALICRKVSCLSQQGLISVHAQCFAPAVLESRKLTRQL